MTQEKGDIGEQAFSKAAEIAISSQLDEVENLDVDIRTDPLKLIQGELESVLLGISGWFGGELVYRHKIAVIGYGNAEQR